MNEQQAARWAATRAKGRTRYILLYGVLLWGLFTGILWSIVMSAVQGWERLPLYLMLALIGFPIGGYFFGAWTWKRAEQVYQKSVSSRSSA
jgi:hypothetical protein